MRFKLLTTVIFTATLVTAGCSSLEKVVYRPDINQGNYLNGDDVAKLKEGMNKNQVLYILGTPMMNDPFDHNQWIYIFWQKPGHKRADEQILTLTFDHNGILKNIKNEHHQPKK